MTHTIEELSQAVKNHAVQHYSDGGWDVVVEAWTDSEIAQAIKENGAETPEAAIKAFEPLVSMWAERQADAAHHRREALGEPA